MAGKLIVVVGAQFGSEGKGAVTAHLVRTSNKPPLVVRVGGPNAGHTAYDDQDRRWPLRQVPVGFVRKDADLAIAAGSEISPSVLASEVSDLDGAGHLVSRRLFIDPNATVLESVHTQQGEAQRRRGSTGKGVGVARAERVRRRAKIVDQLGELLPGSILPVGTLAAERLRAGGTVIVEGTQGYGLGLHTRWYPFTTSGDCTALDMLAQAQIPPWVAPNGLQVWLVARTFPIRVAGDSGPLYRETSWESLGPESGGHIQPEYTTVTHKVRRVGRWDHPLVMQAIKANGGAPAVRLALTMFDYWFPELANQDSLGEHRGAWTELEQLEQKLHARVELVGTGPRTMVDRRP